MGEIIEITDGIVELKTVTTARRVRLQDFTEALLQSSGVRTPILPQGVVFYASKDYKKIYLLEREPAMVKIRYAEDRVHPREYKLAFPFHYWLVLFENYAFDKCSFYFVNKRLTGIEDKLFIPPLPNLHSPDATVCLGNDFRYSVTAENPERINSIASYFFESTFNTDLNHFFKEKAPKQITARKQNQQENCFDAWQRLKLEDINSVEWFPYESLARRVTGLLGKE